MASETISFARGAPSADILPADAVREAAARALAEDWARALSYGTGRGHPGLCEWIAEELHGIEAERVMVTNGSMEAAALLFGHLLEPGDRVIVEQPSYDRTLLLLGRAGVELVPVPLEEDGLDVEEFERALAEGPVKFAHVIPNFHNPAGCTLAQGKRERLVQLAAEHGFWLFEDDPYRLISFGGDELPTMLSLDEAGRVIHASSFSKTVSPGVRVGYLAGPADEIGAIAKRANETYISPNMLAEAIVFELCRSASSPRT
jgi:DNA-binding transcriptional MocR family regulator